MSAPANYGEVKTAWSDQVYDALMPNFDPTGWTDITMPEDGVECETVLFKYNVFPVDKAGLATLCASVTDCNLISVDYSSYAFGFVLDRGL